MRPSLAIILVVVFGCAKPTAPAENGARDAALTFFRAIVARNWDGAYDVLDADGRRVGRDQFVQLATAYRNGLRFEPAGAGVTACDVAGDQAIAHVVLTGRAAAHQRYKEAVTVRRGPAGWGVVLPSSFGQPKRRG